MLTVFASCELYMEVCVCVCVCVCVRGDEVFGYEGKPVLLYYCHFMHVLL